MKDIETNGLDIFYDTAQVIARKAMEIHKIPVLLQEEILEACAVTTQPCDALPDVSIANNIEGRNPVLYCCGVNVGE
jgi:hypothetical protein